MKKRLTKVISVFLVILVVASCMPASGLALLSFSAEEVEKVDRAAMYAGTGTYSGIAVGERTEIQVADGETTYIEFSPEKSGEYIFESFSDVDTYGYIYDSDMDEIATDDDGGDGYNFKVVAYLDAGALYYLGARKYGDDDESISFDVCISLNPVESISFTPAKPIEIIENVDGCWSYYWNDDDEEVEYFCYDTPSIRKEGNILTVNYNDGRGSVDYVFDEDEWKFVSEDGDFIDDIVCNNNQYQKPWTVGGENYLTVEYMEVTCNVPVKIVKNPVESISFTLAKPIELIENDDGYWDYYWNDDDEKVEYFCYYTPSIEKNGNILTVNYNDGRGSVDYAFDEDEWKFVSEDGDFINNIDCNDNQYQKPWTVGGENYFTVKYMGATCNVPVKIVKNPVESISFTPAKPIELIENVDGYWSYYWNDDNEEVEYFRYDTPSIEKNGNILTVNYNDGRGSVNYAFDEDEWKFVSEDGDFINNIACNDNQYQKPWTVGGENYFTAEYMGVTCNVPVKIVKNPVESISFTLAEPIELIENSNGEWDYYWNDDDEEVEYFRYDTPSIRKEGNILTVNYNDGRGSVNYAFDEDEWKFVSEDGDFINNIAYFSNQYQKPWTVGGENYFTVEYMGATCNVPVKIVKNPVESISFTLAEPIELIENVDGYWDYYWNDDDEEKYFYYDIPSIYRKGNVLTVNYNDGRGSVDYAFDDDDWRFVSEDGDFINDIDYNANQYSNHFYVGKNSFTVKCMGKECQVPFTIIENPVASITVSSVKPVSKAKDSVIGRDEDYRKCNSYREGSISFDFTVNYKDGSKKTFKYYANGVFDGYGVECKSLIPDENGKLYFSYLNKDFDITLKTEEDSAEDLFGYVEQNGELYITDLYCSLIELTIPEKINGLPVVGITGLNASGTDKAKNVEKLIIPDSVKFISANALNSLMYCKEMSFGKKIAGLNSEMFRDCVNLESISVSKENPDYTSVDGVLYDKGVTKLIAYPVLREGTYNVPATVTDIDDYLMSHSVENCVFNSNKSLFVKEDGVIYNKDKTIVFSCDNEKSGEYVMPNTVETIAPGAFEYCKNLTSVTVSDKVTEIVYKSFYGCEKLSTVTLPVSVKKIGEKAFSYSGVKTIDLSSIVDIEDRAFCDTSVEKVNFSDSLTKIGSEAFRDCENLTDVKFGNGLTVISEYAFFGCSALNNVTLPKTLKEIQSCAFYYCTALEKIVIPASTQEIKAGAFGSSGLKSITVNSKDTVINYDSFSNCQTDEISVEGKVRFTGSSAYKDGNTILYPDSVTNIVYGEFRNQEYNSMTVLKIPTSVKHIGAHAFDGVKLNDVENGSTYIGDALIYGTRDAVSGVYSLRSGTRIIADCAFERSPVKNLSLPEGLEVIGTDALDGISIASVPSTLKYINKYAFYNTKIDKLNIPASLTEIEDYAFFGLETNKLTVDKNNPDYAIKDDILYSKDFTELVYCPTYKTGEVIIPNTVKTIKAGAFIGCNKLTSIYIPSSVVNIDGDLLGNPLDVYVRYGDSSRHKISYNTSVPTLYVKKGSVAEEYAKANVLPFEWISGQNHTHALLKISAKKATCTASGNNEYWCCSICDEVFKDSAAKTKTTVEAQTLAKLNHSYTGAVKANNNGTHSFKCVNGCNKYGNAVNCSGGTATCLQKAVCSACKVEYGTKLSHSFTGSVKANNDGTHSFKCVNGCNEYGTPVNCSGGVATCTQKANCSYCKTEYGEALGHRFTNYIYNKDAKCGIDGTETAKCDRCTETDTRTAADTALKHNYVAKQTSAPSCTASGLMTYTCSLCKDSYTEDIDALGHTYQTVTTKATLTKNGETEEKCSLCGDVKTTATIYYPKTFKLSAKSAVYTGKYIKPTVTVKDSNGNKISSSNYTVKYSDNKNVGTAKVTITFKGNYSGTKTISFTIKPKQVTGLKASSVKKTSIKLSWSKVTGAKYYKVEQSTDGKKWKTLCTTGKTSYTVSKLTAGKKYQYRVTALNSTKKIAGKASSVLKTGTLTSAPSITLKSTKSKTATVSWKKVTGASKYTVYKSTDGKKWTKVTTTSKTTYTVTKLTGGKKIYVKVTAINAYGKASAASTEKKVTVKK